MKKIPRSFKNKLIERRFLERKFHRSNRKRKNQRHVARSWVRKSNLAMPERIGLEPHTGRSETLSIIARIRSMSAGNKGTLCLDFSATTYPDSVGMILLLATVDFVHRHTGRRCVKAINVRSNRVRQVLQQIGLAEKLGMRHPVDITRSDVRLWRYVSESCVDAQKIGEHFEMLCKEFNIAEERRQSLYNAFTEAIDNAHGHAYDEVMMKEMSARIFPSDKRWWMFFGVIDSKLTIVTCDLGLGIPATVKRQGHWEKVCQFLADPVGRSDDGNIIKATIAQARSRTEDPHRGKGMARLKKAIEDNGQGGLIVCSNRGWYAFKEFEYTKSYKDQVEGTIIGWSIPISAG
jgi:anti-anti-sigma regulatory factor